MAAGAHAWCCRCVVWRCHCGGSVRRRCRAHGAAELAAAAGDIRRRVRYPKCTIRPPPSRLQPRVKPAAGRGRRTAGWQAGGRGRRACSGYQRRRSRAAARRRGRRRSTGERGDV
uniref:Uncharacterized protein n=1 Tax=Arundo donax TaxID=35708 RepID=A0A0A9GDK7_ARUDO